MKNNFIKTLLIIFIFLSGKYLQAETPAKLFLNKFVSIGIKKLKSLEAQNKINDRNGKSQLNQYIIYIDCAKMLEDEKWVGTKSERISVNDLDRINKIAVSFDKEINTTERKARFYILYVDRYPISLIKKENIQSYSQLKNSPSRKEEVKIAIEKAKSDVNKGIESILSAVPTLTTTHSIWLAHAIGTIVWGENVKNLNGTIEKIIGSYGFSQIKIGDSDIERSKKADDYLRQMISGSNVSGVPSQRLELRTTAMAQWLKNIVNNTDDFKNSIVLKYNSSNPNVAGWYNSPAGTKENKDYATEGSKRFYDYTGRFSNNQAAILAGFADPTGVLIFTDNETGKKTITNLKTQLTQSHSFHVYWFHIDVKGKIQSQIYYSADFLQKTALATINGKIPDQLDRQIGEIYNQSCGQIKNIADLVDIMNFEGKFLKIISSLLNNDFSKGGLQIPENWWNPSSNDYIFKDIISHIPDEYKSIFKPLQEIVSHYLLEFGMEQ